MAPIGPLHEDVVDLLNRWSMQNLSEEMARVRVQNSVGLSELESAPEPDIAWVAPRRYRRERPSPADIFLVIEVAETSLDYDRGEKAAMYADAGIADYWVVNLRAREVEVYRDPQVGRYREVRVFRGHDELRPLAFPTVVLRPSMLWE